MKKRHFIDTNKGITALIILVMIAAFGQWENSTAWVYLGIHGTYGILWVLKSRIFPDESWEENCSLGLGLVYWFGLTLYWVAPLIITSQSIQVPAWYLGLCVSIYAFGVFFHFTSDMQKHTSLTLHPERLITTGMMSRVRNPNYFGELLIYLSFAMLARHWLPVVILILAVIVVWIFFMKKKDRSLSRYPEFEDYKKRTKLFIPYIL
ncbi:MAG: DUF1295 domain-containing protein [Anaerolineales bacterium]|nr:DUF1295 domain-containing protein [Anaerolineales bacterium]